MWFLLGTTLTASFFDSLNPSAIAQQMLLQAMVKKKRHIWFFICGIGTANLIMGLAIYYGIATWVSKFLTKIVNAYPLYVYGAAAIGGIVLLGAGKDFRAPEPDEEYIIQLCGDTVILNNGLLVEALSRLPVWKQEMVYLSYFRRIPQREIGRRYGRSRSAAGYHIRKAVRQLHEEMEGMTHEE